MKKAILIIMLLIISIVFTACGSQVEQNYTYSSKKSTNAETKNTNKSLELTDDNSNIQKIILSISGQENESPYDEEVEEFLKEIETCTNVPDSIMINKIGSISIIYKNSDEKIEYAALYIASDNNIYAKYIADKETDYAYKIDLDKLIH